MALIGKYFRRININAMVDTAFPIRLGAASNSTILKSCLALLCQGKTDFEAIEAYRRGKRGDDAFFTRVLGLGSVPSSPTLRQRLDAHASDWFDLASDINAALLSLRINGAPIDHPGRDAGQSQSGRWAHRMADAARGQARMRQARSHKLTSQSMLQQRQKSGGRCAAKQRGDHRWIESNRPKQPPLASQNQQLGIFRSKCPRKPDWRS